MKDRLSPSMSKSAWNMCCNFLHFHEKSFHVYFTYSKSCNGILFGRAVVAIRTCLSTVGPLVLQQSRLGDQIHRIFFKEHWVLNVAWEINTWEIWPLQVCTKLVTMHLIHLPKENYESIVYFFWQRLYCERGKVPGKSFLIRSENGL